LFVVSERKLAIW